VSRGVALVIESAGGKMALNPGKNVNEQEGGKADETDEIAHEPLHRGRADLAGGDDVVFVNAEDAGKGGEEGGDGTNGDVADDILAMAEGRVDFPAVAKKYGSGKVEGVGTDTAGDGGPGEQGLVVDGETGQGVGEDEQWSVARVDGKHDREDQAGGREPSGEAQIGRDENDFGTIEKKISDDDAERKDYMRGNDMFARDRGGGGGFLIPILRAIGVHGVGVSGRQELWDF